jgi:hypothetical protein
MPQAECPQNAVISAAARFPRRNDRDEVGAGPSFGARPDHQLRGSSRPRRAAPWIWCPARPGRQQMDRPGVPAPRRGGWLDRGEILLRGWFLRGSSFSGVVPARGPLRHSSCQLYSNWRNWRTGAKRRTLKQTVAPVVRQFVNLVIRHHNILRVVLRVIPV